MWPLAVVWQGRIIGAVVVTLLVVIATIRFLVGLLDRLVYAAQRLAD